MILKEYEVCKYSVTCPYNNQTGQNFCIGGSSKRPGPFICDLVSVEGVFTESSFRSKFDETGKMKVIMENK